MTTYPKLFARSFNLHYLRDEYDFQLTIFCRLQVVANWPSFTAYLASFFFGFKLLNCGHVTDK